MASSTVTQLCFTEPLSFPITDFAIPNITVVLLLVYFMCSNIIATKCNVKRLMDVIRQAENSVHRITREQSDYLQGLWLTVFKEQPPGHLTVWSPSSFQNSVCELARRAIVKVKEVKRLATVHAYKQSITQWIISKDQEK